MSHLQIWQGRDLSVLLQPATRGRSFRKFDCQTQQVLSWHLLWGCNYINDYNWGKNTLALLCKSHFSSGRFQSVPAGLGSLFSEANASTQDRAAQLGLFLILTALWCQMSPVEPIGSHVRCAPLLVWRYRHTHAHLLTHMKTSVVLKNSLGVENSLKATFWGSLILESGF